MMSIQVVIVYVKTQLSNQLELLINHSWLLPARPPQVTEIELGNNVPWQLDYLIW